MVILHHISKSLVILHQNSFSFFFLAPKIGYSTPRIQNHGYSTPQIKIIGCSTPHIKIIGYSTPHIQNHDE